MLDHERAIEGGCEREIVLGRKVMMIGWEIVGTILDCLDHGKGVMGGEDNHERVVESPGLSMWSGSEFSIKLLKIVYNSWWRKRRVIRPPPLPPFFARFLRL